MSFRNVTDGQLEAVRRRVAQALDTTEDQLAATYLQRTRQGIAPRQTDDTEGNPHDPNTPTA